MYLTRGAGEGLAVAIVESDQPHPDLAAVTDENGEFVLGDLPPGRYVVAALDSRREVLLHDPDDVAEVQFVVTPGVGDVA